MSPRRAGSGPGMERVTRIRVMRERIAAIHRAGGKIAFVPTMGALHEGHLSLIREARRCGTATAVSIFVNPLQFGPAEDFERYPRDPEGDREKCAAEGVDLLFEPEAAEIFPPGHATTVRMGPVGEILEGAARSGHFDGVATVVAKLFLIVQPQVALFGQKDYQQTVVIRRLVRDLDFDVKIAVLPTVREPDGLAMSSRNRYLKGEDRKAAAALYRALREAQAVAAAGGPDPRKIEAAAKRVIEAEPRMALEYIRAADPETLAPVETRDKPFVLLLAARVGPVRLIDNIMIG